MMNSALPPVITPGPAAPPVHLIADLARLVTPGDRRAALTLASAR